MMVATIVVRHRTFSVISAGLRFVKGNPVTHTAIRERERDRQTDRQTERQRETERQTDRQRQRHRDTERERQRQRQGGKRER